MIQRVRRLRATLPVVIPLVASVCFFLGAAAPGETKNDDSPKPPPKDAQVLFDGKDLSGWTTLGGKPAEWKVEDGTMEVVPGKGDIRTKETFGPDFELHVEFWLPLLPEAKSQARANSGVFIQGRYEIQVLDSYKNDTYAKGECAALYGILGTSKNANKPPETWQTYHITFRAPQVDDQNKVTEKGEVTVVFNGETVIDKGRFDRANTGNAKEPLAGPGPIRLQDHGNKVRFRNIWIKK